MRWSSERWGVRVAVVSLWLAMYIGFARAQTVPALINYQGQLSTPSGVPLTTADYELSFSIYDSLEGGTVVWGPQRFNGNTGLGLGGKVPVVQGYFNVALGPVDTSGRSLTASFGSATRFVEITVGTNQPIRPRQQLLTAPFAFQSAVAADAVKLAGYDWSSILSSGNNPETGSLNGGKIQAGSIQRDQIAAGAVDDSRRAPLTVLRSRLRHLVYVGTKQPDGVNSDSFTRILYRTPVQVTNLAITVTSSGRPIWVGLSGVGRQTLSITDDSSYVAFTTSNPNGSQNFPDVDFDIVDLDDGGSSVMSAKIRTRADTMLDWQRCSGVVALSPGTHRLVLAITVHRIPAEEAVVEDIITFQKIVLSAYGL